MKYWLALICCFLWVSREAFCSCTDTVYFLMIEQRFAGPRDSFVLPLTRPEHIAYAREFLTPGSTNRVLWAITKIRKGPDGLNRDFLAFGAPQWSWYVTEFIGFAEYVVEEIQTTATLLERHVEYLMPGEESGGAFAYRVFAEMLPPPCTSVSSVTATNGVQLTWDDLGVHYVYTVEVSVSLDPPNWSPAPGGQWPTSSTTWTDTTQQTGQRFYRVRAQFKVP